MKHEHGSDFGSEYGSEYRSDYGSEYGGGSGSEYGGEYGSDYGSEYGGDYRIEYRSEASSHRRHGGGAHSHRSPRRSRRRIYAGIATGCALVTGFLVVHTGDAGSAEGAIGAQQSAAAAAANASHPLAPGPDATQGPSATDGSAPGAATTAASGAGAGAGKGSKSSAAPTRPTTSAAAVTSTTPRKPVSSGTATAGSAGASASGSSSLDDAAVQQVLALINKARAAQGLAPYTITSGLTTSSSRHNALMASGCGLSHQCSGEPAIGDRVTAAGVHWSSCGENIGEGGPVSRTSAGIASMAVGLTQSMLDEQPPDDGHRRNILSTDFTHIGITVGIDANGTVWMTQDFSS